MTVEACIHIANLFYVASYLCRDMLWLRVLTCCGLIFGIVFFCTQSAAMFAPASWMTVFLVVNLVQIARIIRERATMRLTPRQEQIGTLMLNHLSRDDLLNILTKSMCENRSDWDLLERHREIVLNAEQQTVRNVAFDRLSNGELINLIVRRFWNAIRQHRRGRFFRVFGYRRARPVAAAM